MNLKNQMRIIRDFPKSLYINLRCLPIKQAIKMPIRIKWNVKIGKIDKKCIYIKSNNIKKYMIKLGFQGAKFVSENNSYFTIKNGGKVFINGNITIAEGFNILIDGGRLELGNNLYANRNLQVQCEKNIVLGDNDLLGWNVNLRDTDGHKIFENNNEKECVEDIVIGEHVWIASDVTVLKGTHVFKDCIVACNSLVCGKKFNNDRSLIAGSPAKIIKNNIDWIE